MEEIADRVHLKCSQSAKGAWQMEVSVESGSNEASKEMLQKGIEDSIYVLKSLELPIAGEILEKK